MISLIMAAGDNTRWNGRIPKQLAEIGGQPLIQRTYRQASLYRGSPIIVTHNPAIKALELNCFEPQFRRWIVETLLSTRQLWQERTAVLLGDVIYSDYTMRLLLANRDPLAVYGFKWEIVGLSFDSEAWGDVILALENAKHNAEKGGRGKLWEFYRSYCHIPLEATDYVECSVFNEVEDYTNDIDSMQEYWLFLQNNPWAGKKEMTDIVREYAA
jgi:hypothetical protein